MTIEQQKGLLEIFKKFPTSKTPILCFEKDKKIIEESSKIFSEKLMKNLFKHKSKQ